MRRRDDGEGGWNRVGNKWKLSKRYGIDSATGTYQRKAFYGITKTEAKEKAEEYEQRLSLNIDVQEAEQKLSVWLPKWFDRRVRSIGMKDTSQDVRRRQIKIILDILGNVAVNELTTQHLDTLCASISAKSTRFDAYILLKRSYQSALKRKLIVLNPFDSHDASPEDVSKRRERGRALTTDEITTLVQRTNTTRIGPMIQFMLETGVRIGEALALQQDDIDFGNSKVTIRHNRTKYGIGTTKSNRPRVLLLAQTTIELLHKQLDTIKAERLMRKRWENTDPSGNEIFVFPSEAGTPSHYSAIARQWRRLVREAGFKDTKKDGGITFHSLRHTWIGTHALHAGVPIHVVKDRLGHQDIRTTLDIYGHVLTGGEESAAAVFEEIFSA